MRRRRPRLSLLAAAIGVVVLVVFWQSYARPHARRPTVAIDVAPQPTSLFKVQLVELRPGATACLSDVTVTTRSTIANVQVGTYGRRSGPLQLTLRSPSYVERVAIAASSYSDNAVLGVPLAGPRRDALVDACITNSGRRRAALYGSAERSRSVTTVDGKRQPVNFALQLVDAQPRSLLHRLPQILTRMTVLKPGIVADWWLWVLVVGAFGVIPVALVITYAAAAARDDD